MAVQILIAITHNMTPELAQHIVDTGIDPELKRLYTTIKECYAAHTAQEISQVFALIRAEYTLEHGEPK